MQVVAVSLVVVSTVASLGVALWIWLALDSIGDELRDFVSFEGFHFKDPSDSAAEREACR
jgi:hypothetical protein